MDARQTSPHTPLPPPEPRSAGAGETWSPQRRYEQQRKKAIWEVAGLPDSLHHGSFLLFPPAAAAAIGTITHRQSGRKWHKPPLQAEISFKFNSHAFSPLFGFFFFFWCVSLSTYTPLTPHPLSPEAGSLTDF